MMHINKAGVWITLILYFGYNQLTVAGTKTVEACYNTENLRIASPNCQEKYIRIQTVMVGYNQNNCSPENDTCPFQLIDENNSFSKHVRNACDGKNSCDISSSYLRSNFSFVYCGSGTTKHLRNLLMVNYTCADTIITGPPPTTTDVSTGGNKDSSAVYIAVPVAAVVVLTIFVIVLLVTFHRRRMCLWEEKTASLAGIKPSARTDNNNMERKQSPPSYDTVEEPYHVLDESATYYNSDDVTLTTQTKRSDVHLLQDNLYSLPSSQSEVTSPLQTQLTADQQTEQPGLSNKSYTDHCITGKANVPGGNNSEYSIAEEVMPSKRKKTKLPPVYTEVNKNRNPIKKNQVGSGDRGYVNHPLNGTGGSSFEGDQPEMIDNDIYEGTSDDDSLPGGAAYGNTSSHHKEVTEYTENDLYGTD